jgi:hypothetical protein
MVVMVDLLVESRSGRPLVVVSMAIFIGAAVCLAEVLAVSASRARPRACFLMENGEFLSDRAAFDRSGQDRGPVRPSRRARGGKTDLASQDVAIFIPNFSACYAY